MLKKVSLKAVALLLCLAFALAVFAACNSNADKPDDGNSQGGNTDTSGGDNTETGSNSNGESNADNENTGDENTGNENTGDENNGNENTGDENTGNENNGDENTGDENNGNENTGDENTNTDPVFDLTGVEPIRYTTLGADYQYTVGGGSKLTKYMDEPKESFLGVCKYFDSNGFKLYGYNEMGNVLAATYTRAGLMMHVYWIGGELNELAIVNGRESGKALPPAVPEVTEGKYDTVITQMRAVEADVSTQINGMGYVVRLADGSFLVFDGGYSTRVDELWDTLVTLNGGEDGIVIRAWLLTHGHGDHTQCYFAFADKYASRVTLETLLFSPFQDETSKYLGALIKFKGAEALCVHTGMVFRFCDVKLEILCATDEIYYDGDSDDYNNSSIVSRIYKDGGKSCMILGDAGDDVSTRLIPMYGEYLQSDICQAAHHGVEDFTIEAYRLIRAAIWFYPCNTKLYNITNRDREVRDEIKNAEYTKKIYLHDRRTRPVESFNS